jgi:hypothetical protein
MSQFVLRHGIRMIDFVPQNQEGSLCKVFHGEKGVEFGFGFWETFVVLGIHKEDDARDFGEIITPEAAGCRRNECEKSNFVLRMDKSVQVFVPC